MREVEELWEPIPNFDNYQVSTYGNVYNRKLNRLVPGRMRKSGAIKVALHQDGRVRDTYVHILMMEVFFGGYTPGVQIKHLDGDRSNNHISNLSQYNKKVEGGKRLGRRLLKVRKVLVHQTGEIFDSPLVLADALGCDPGNIYRVLKGGRRSYRGLTFEYIDRFTTDFAK